MIYEDTEIEISDSRIVAQYLAFRFDRYEFKKVDGVLFVYGYHDKEYGEDEIEIEWREKVLFKPDFSFSYEILFDALLLHRNLEICSSKRPSPFCRPALEEIITENDLEQIMLFVKKHGFPFLGDSEEPNVCCNDIPYETKNLTVLNILHEVAPVCNGARFPVCRFIYWLDMLIMDDLLNILARYDRLAEQMELLLSDRDKETLSRKRDFMKNNPRSLGLKSPNYNTFTMRFDNKQQALIVSLENIMHLCSYYLSIMASSGNVGSGYIRICRGCGKLFISENPRLKYCQNPCTRQNIFMKKKRSK